MSVNQALELLQAQHVGMLATQSRDMPGYPFGSMVPYSLSAQYYPVMLISNIAQHYLNIQAIAKVSLLVVESGVADVQAAQRLTWVADAQPISENDTQTMEQHYQRFPSVRDYHQTLGFCFYQLIPVRICHIAGFGKIHWYDQQQWV